MVYLQASRKAEERLGMSRPTAQARHHFNVPSEWFRVNHVQPPILSLHIPFPKPPSSSFLLSRTTYSEQAASIKPVRRASLCIDPEDTDL
jgi:hypothetical protein